MENRLKMIVDAYLKQSGMNLRTFSQKCGIPYTSLRSNLFDANPTYPMMKAVAKGLDVPVERIVRVIEYPELPVFPTLYTDESEELNNIPIYKDSVLKNGNLFDPLDVVKTIKISDDLLDKSQDHFGVLHTVNGKEVIDIYAKDIQPSEDESGYFLCADKDLGKRIYLPKDDIAVLVDPDDPHEIQAFSPQKDSNYKCLGKFTIRISMF
jgi:lambda repressor-like predicted transcriptional regulator